MRPEKKIILCADDYSFKPDISEAIITLLKKNRLSAVSCMVNTKYWVEHANELKPFLSKVDVGLHFALTDIQPVVAPLYKHPNIIIKAYLRKILQAEIEKELEQQILKFEKTLGRRPDFIDGHQHIHQLPIIRSALLSVYKKCFPERSCYIRVPVIKSHTVKSFIITLTGALALKKQLVLNNIPHNESFSGVYSFSNAKNYPQYFRYFLKNIGSEGLIMCHPGFSGFRQDEFNYLNSDQFLRDCAKSLCTLRTFNSH